MGPTHREVTRVDPGAITDVDYRFNDTDARQVWQGMVNDATFRGWIDRWIQEHGGQRPTIIVGPIKNNTQDLINTKLFTRNFEREMLNSGKVRVVGAKDDRGELREALITAELQLAKVPDLEAQLLRRGVGHRDVQRIELFRQLLDGAAETIETARLDRLAHRRLRLLQALCLKVRQGRHLLERHLLTR